MAMSPRELLTRLRGMSRKQLEVFSLPLIYMAGWMVFIGPAIGDATGFDTPMTTMTGYSPTITLSVRTFLAVSTFIGFMMAYVYMRPRLFGHDPEEYWGM